MHWSVYVHTVVHCTCVPQLAVGGPTPGRLQRLRVGLAPACLELQTPFNWQCAFPQALQAALAAACAGQQPRCLPSTDIADSAHVIVSLDLHAPLCTWDSTRHSKHFRLPGFLPGGAGCGQPRRAEGQRKCEDGDDGDATAAVAANSNALDLQT